MAKIRLIIATIFLGYSITTNAQYNVSSDLQVMNMGHFKGWQTNNLTGLGLDVGISNNSGYIMAFDRTNSTYHDLRIKAVGGFNKGITLSTNGNIGIDIDNPDSKLTVNGKIRSEEVKVEVINVPDYVFEAEYELRTLKETKNFISENKHLPEIPSAKEIESNGGIEVGDMNMKLLKKIEELTLYQIELMEKLEQQNAALEGVKKELQDLKN